MYKKIRKIVAYLLVMALLLSTLPLNTLDVIASALDNTVVEDKSGALDSTYYNPSAVEVETGSGLKDMNPSNPANHFAKKPSKSELSSGSLSAMSSTSDSEAIKGYNKMAQLAERQDYQALELYKKSIYSTGYNAYYEIHNLAIAITAGCTTDLQKVQAIYNWMCINIFYDYDLLEGRASYECSAFNTLSLGRGVCEGYAELTNALIRETGIPAKVVIGYAGESVSASDIISGSSNHAWVEAYFDPNGSTQSKKWVSLDTTWGSRNIYKNNLWNGSPTRPTSGLTPLQDYFNIADDLFNATHIIVDTEFNFKAAYYASPSIAVTPVTTVASGCQPYLNATVPTTSSVGANLFKNVADLTNINLTGVLFPSGKMHS